MKYVLLIYQGTTPLHGTPEWDALPADQQKTVYADYEALNQEPQHHCLALGSVECSNGRRAVRPGEGTTGDQGSIGVHFRLWGTDTNGAVSVADDQLSDRSVTDGDAHGCTWKMAGSAPPPRRCSASDRQPSRLHVAGSHSSLHVRE